MANREHLQVLRRGVTAWNSWREANPDVQPELTRANLQRIDLSAADLAGADLRRTNLTRTGLTRADLSGAMLTGALLCNADLTGCSLVDADLARADLTGADLTCANLTGADLRRSNLVRVKLDGAMLTGSRLWESQRSGWSIEIVICDHAFWDRAAEKRTSYGPAEFERLHAEKGAVELLYEGGISPAEITTLPLLMRYLEEIQEGCVLRMRSLEEVASGSRVTFVIEETGGADATILKDRLDRLSKRLQAATHLFLQESQSKRLLVEEYASYRRRVAPYLQGALQERPPEQQPQNRGQVEK